MKARSAAGLFRYLECTTRMKMGGTPMTDLLLCGSSKKGARTEPKTMMTAVEATTTVMTRRLL